MNSKLRLGIKPVYLLLVLAFVAYLVLALRVDIPDWDALCYIMNAKTLLGKEAYFEWHRPILWPFLIAIFGGSELAAKLLGVFLATFTVYAIYLLSKEMFDEWTGIYSSAIFMVIPLIQYWAYRMYTSIPMIGLSAMAFYFLVRYTKQKKDRGKEVDLYLFFLFSALAYLMRYVGLMTLFVGLFYLVLIKKINKKNVKYILYGLVIFSLILSPWLYFNYVNTGDPLYSPKIAKAQMDRVAPTQLDFYFRKWGVTFTYPLTVLVVIGLLFFYFRDLKVKDSIVIKNKEYLLALLIFFSYFLYFQAFLNLKLTRYLIPCMLGWSILSGKGLKDLVSLFKGKEAYLRYGSIVVLLLIFVGGTYLNMGSIMHCGSDVDELSSFLNSLDGNGASTLWPYMNYYSDMRVKWIPHTYGELENDTKTLGVRYVIVTEHPIEPTWATTHFFDSNGNWTLLKTFDICLGRIGIYEYKGNVSGDIVEIEDPLSGKNFVPLRFFP